MTCIAGGMFAESQEGDDAASVSSGVDNEEELVSPAASRGGALTSTARRKGLPTPPATPSTSRGAFFHPVVAASVAFRPSGQCTMLMSFRAA